jgi:hypothetical protein
MHQFNVEIISTRRVSNGASITPDTVQVNGEEAEFIERHCRSVFGFDEYVIKFEDGHQGDIPRSKARHGQCFSELAFLSGTLEKKHRRHFLPILGYGIAVSSGHVFVWVVQRRIPIDEEEFKEEHHHLLGEIIDRYDFGDLEEGQNTTIVNGELVIFDYAI